jgi:hypothetical protein
MTSVHPTPMTQPPTLYVHILVAARSTAKAEKESASFFFPCLPWADWSFSQRRWMMPRHALDPCCAHSGLVMNTRCPLQAQNAHNRTQSIYEQHQNVSRQWAQPDISWMGKWAVREKKERSKQYLCSTNNNNYVHI